MDECNGDRKSRSDGKSKVRGVPPSFGYVKRPTNANGKESRTAQVSAVPRTKVITDFHFFLHYISGLNTAKCHQKSVSVTSTYESYELPSFYYFFMC